MQFSGFSIRSTPGFDFADFHSRWSRARISAIRSALTSVGAEVSTQEILLISSVPSEQQEKVLREVYRKSWRFGKSATAHFGLIWEVPDLLELLRIPGIPCVTGGWSISSELPKLQRSGCAQNTQRDPFFCDYWREALDGLIAGLCEEVRFARHESQGRGDAQCLDVLYTDSQDETAASHRWKPIPNEVSQALREIQLQFSRNQIELSLLGVSERTLYYRMESPKGPLCGAGGRLLHDSFKKEVAKWFPDFGVQDASPLAVYGGAN